MRMFLLRVHPALELKVKGDGWVRTLRGRGGGAKPYLERLLGSYRSCQIYTAYRYSWKYILIELFFGFEYDFSSKHCCVVFHICICIGYT